MVLNFGKVDFVLRVLRKISVMVLFLKVMWLCVILLFVIFTAGL